MRSLASWLDYIAGQHWQSIDMGLERMRTMVARMQLQHPATTVITVAGTNGKGSTCVACEALLRRAGKRTGVTLSPHVARFNERIRIDGKEADDEQICRAFAAVEAARETDALPLTYFEFSALAALWCFKQCEVEVAVLEIGLGGRLDAFNAVDADVAAITSIGFDHESFLGNSLERIGAEKAGILRPAQHVALGVGMPDSVLSRCRELSLQPQVVGATLTCRPESKDTWQVLQGDQVVQTQVPYGHCAPHNLLLAWLAVAGVVTLDYADLAEVAAQINLPGRMQQLDVEDRRWILDVAHNPAGAEFLMQQLRDRGIEPRLIICGMLRDKHHTQVYDAVRCAFNAPWIFMDTQGERALSAAELAAALPAGAGKVAANWAEVFREVNSATAVGDVILIFGSFNLIEQFLQRDKSSDT